MAPSCAGAAPAWAETGMKLLPLLFYLWVFEPDPQALPGAAIAIAVGFATFENVCYLAENGADNFTFLLIRGFSAGALHILCGILSGFGVSYGFRRRRVESRRLSVPLAADRLPVCCQAAAAQNMACRRLPVMPRPQRQSRVRTGQSVRLH